MISLGQLFEKRPRGAAAEQRLAGAYEAVFSGNGGPEDASLVLVDLAIESRYFDTTPAGTADEVLQHMAGSRFVFGRIVRQMNMPPRELSALIQRVVDENLIDQQIMEGQN